MDYKLFNPETVKILPDTESLASALNAFEHSKFEMVVVVEKSGKFVGLLTTNDARRALERSDFATDCPLASYVFQGQHDLNGKQIYTTRHCQ